MRSNDRPTVLKRGLSLFAILLIGTMVAACGSAASAPGALQPVGGPAGAAPGGETGGDNSGNAGGSPRDVVFAAGAADLLIIKTGSMALQVAGIDAALAAATQQVTALGGYASGSDRSGDEESAQATITYRIPAASWDEALAGLRGLATKVLAERSATEDVTTQVVDLAARIRNLQATETALQGIMNRATEIKDVLAVQAELTSVRGQIEQLTAQKSHLEAQAAFSTLSVTFALKPDPVLTETQQFDPATEVDQASASLVNVLQGLATAGIWFAIVWLPILLVLAIVVAIGVAVARRLRRVGDSGGAGTPPVEPVPEAGA